VGVALLVALVAADDVAQVRDALPMHRQLAARKL
jgi:hypothetical protein